MTFTHPLPCLDFSCFCIYLVTLLGRMSRSSRLSPIVAITLSRISSSVIALTSARIHICPPHRTASASYKKCYILLNVCRLRMRSAA
ncbi:hypothetical protein OH76DRAFT_616475 [Lentinus brumalis]|uniref:Uncharacterized protein n=1 Tax=Lentinus brumalis TaxID=2498619 RepID=A0A371D8W5_9APHY|nr:hypothetical protein OH76DRAFT_616475 [Polyporus brumalis]